MACKLCRIRADIPGKLCEATGNAVRSSEYQDPPLLQIGFINELFLLFKMKEIICHGHGLMLGGYSAEDRLLQEIMFLESQLRGAEVRNICYVPQLIENQELTRQLQRQFTLCYSIILGCIANGAPLHIIQQELRQCFTRMCSAYLQGQIVSMPSTSIFNTTVLGNPVRQETVVI